MKFNNIDKITIVGLLKFPYSLYDVLRTLAYLATIVSSKTYKKYLSIKCLDGQWPFINTVSNLFISTVGVQLNLKLMN